MALIDITLAVIAVQSTHSLPAEKEGARWQIGQIQDVYKTRDLASIVDGEFRMNNAIGTKVRVFIHVRNVPVSSAKRIRRLLAEPIEVPSIEIVNDKDGNEVEIVSVAMVHRSIFKVRLADIPNAAKNTLKDNREITVSWTEFKPYICRSDTLAVIKDGEL